MGFAGSPALGALLPAKAGWEEQLGKVLYYHCFRCPSNKSRFSAAGLVAAPWPQVAWWWRGADLTRRLLAAQGRAEAEAEAKRRRLEAVEFQGG